MFLFILCILTLNINQDSILVKQKNVSGFSNLVSITTDGKNNTYVLDAETNEIIKFNDKIEELKRIGRKGWNNGEFDSPSSIDGSSGLDILVCDSRNFRIQRFDLNLSFISSIYTNNETFPPNLQYQTPNASVFVNSSLYVIDGDNKRIVIYYPNGVPFLSFGGFQSANNPLVNPVKIVKDSDNNIFILDKGKSSVDVYDGFGNFINSFIADNIISVSVFNNLIYLLLNKEIIIYDSRKKSFSGKILMPEDSDRKILKDFQLLTNHKFLFITQNSLFLYSLN